MTTGSTKEVVDRIVRNLKERPHELIGPHATIDPHVAEVMDCVDEERRLSWKQLHRRVTI